MFLQHKNEAIGHDIGRKEDDQLLQRSIVQRGRLVALYFMPNKNAKQLKICKVYKISYMQNMNMQSRTIAEKLATSVSVPNGCQQICIRTLYMHIPLQTDRNACYKRCNALNPIDKVDKELRLMSIMSSICGPSEDRQTIVCR